MPKKAPEISKDYNESSKKLNGQTYRAYFITICVDGRQSLLGGVIEGKMMLNERGWIVDEEWLMIAEQHPDVELDAYIIMPNHFHAIVKLTDEPGELTPTADPAVPLLPNQMGNKPVSLRSIVRSFKLSTTRRISNLTGYNSDESVDVKLWQPDYHQRVIRNGAALSAFRKYIFENPSNWHLDQMCPISPRKGPDPYKQ